LGITSLGCGNHICYHITQGAKLSAAFVYVPGIFADNNPESFATVKEPLLLKYLQ
jgi:hypothetical protein